MSFKFFKTFFYIIIILPVYEAGQPLVAGETNRFGIYISTSYVPVSFVLSLFLTLYFVAENNNTSPTVGTVTKFYGTVK